MQREYKAGSSTSLKPQKYASLSGKHFPYKANMGRAKEFFPHLRRLFVPSTFCSFRFFPWPNVKNFFAKPTFALFGNVCYIVYTKSLVRYAYATSETYNSVIIASCFSFPSLLEDITRNMHGKNESQVSK